MNNPYPKDDGSFVIFETEDDEQEEEEGEKYWHSQEKSTAGRWRICLSIT